MLHAPVYSIRYIRRIKHVYLCPGPSAATTTMSASICQTCPCRPCPLHCDDVVPRCPPPPGPPSAHGMRKRNRERIWWWWWWFGWKCKNIYTTFRHTHFTRISFLCRRNVINRRSSMMLISSSKRIPNISTRSLGYCVHRTPYKSSGQPPSAEYASGQTTKRWVATATAKVTGRALMGTSYRSSQQRQLASSR